MNLANDEAHWLAGLLEGEGSFLAAPPSAPNRPCISIEMTDQDVIVHAASVMGIAYIHEGRRHPERGWKPSYRIALRGTRGVRFMLALRPLMGELRRGQIDAALRDYAPKQARIRTSLVCLSGGCGRSSYARDLCRRHYEQFVKESGGRAPRLTLSDLAPQVAWDWSPSARLAYLAGLLEGEGTFSPGPPSSPTWCHLVLKMCERDVVEHAHRLMGSTPIREIRNQERPRWRTAYETLIGARRAEALMREVRPLMGKRRQAQIDRALACRVSLRHLRLIPAPPHCTVQGCRAPHRGRGLCHKHYMGWLRSSGSSAIRESRRTGANMK